MSERPTMMPTRLRILQVNLNKSSKAHLELYNKVSRREWDIVLVQEPHVTVMGNIRTPNGYVTVTPVDRYKDDAPTTRAVTWVSSVMSTHWFYARGFGISHISTLTRIFLDLRTTDIPCDLIRLHKPSEVFNTLTFPQSECPADMSTISEDSIMCSHITHHYTFKYSIQATHMLQHI